MDNLETYRALSDVPTFVGVFPSELLPTHTLPGLVRYTVIINVDIHTDPGSHWVAVHLEQDVTEWLLLRLVQNLPGRPNYTQVRTKYLQSVDLQHSHPSRFQHRRVRTLRMSLRALQGEGLSPRQFNNVFGTTEQDWQVEAAFVR